MYYFNNNDNTNNNNNSTSDNNNTSQQRHYNHNGPLFSQPLDPSTLNGVPTEFLNEQHNYDNLILDYPIFDTSHNYDFYSQAQQAPLMDPQEAILLSDPNFLRQHQLLQDQQKEMHTRLLHDEDEERHGVVEQDPIMVSNLTTMFEPKQEVQVKMEQPESEEDKKTKRNSHRRQQVIMKSNNEENEEKASNNKIDHQRRFNELQARFRVNYARKPTSSQQQNHVKSTQTINTTTTNTNTTSTTNHTNNNNNKPSTKQQPSSTFPASFDENATAATASPHQKPISIPTTPTVQINKPPSIASTPPVVIGGMVMNNEEFNGETSTSLSSSFPSRTMPIQIQRVPRHNSSQPFDAESHQKQLDSQLDKVDFNDITVSELKEMLRQRGKPATGKKAVLLQRLQEERDIAKGGRSAGSYGSLNGGGRILSNRHSQPLPFSRSVTGESPQRPRSFQGSSPVMIHNGSPNNNLTASPSSPSATTFIPGSPSGSLHRSIANMHIGSPPAISRRYSPYSPRLSSSPKPTHHEYSSSVPLTSGDLSSSPINNNSYMNNNAVPTNNSNNNMMLSSSYSARSSRIYNNPKTYKPFMSSALATPDREEDVNPFDSYYVGGGDPPIKEEEIPVEELHHPSGSDMTNNNNMDWIDPSSFDILLQQQVSHQQMNDMGGQQALPPQQVLTNEQIMALLNSQQQANAFDFKLDDSNFNPEHHQPYYHHQ